MYHEELDKISDRIYEKIASDDNSVMCKNVKKLDPVEKTVFCAYQYYLEQMNDGFMEIFTGYMSPLVFEIREALKELNSLWDCLSMAGALTDEELKIANETFEVIYNYVKEKEGYV